MNIFEGHINGSKPVIVDFSAGWSNPGRLMDPILHEIKEEAGGKITVLKIDIDKEPAYKEFYNIITVPTIIVFKNGKIIWRKNGLATAHELIEQVSLHY
ncbi:MAG TPA: thioredoxin family protein [Chitinophagaceae bacterium]